MAKPFAVRLGLRVYQMWRTLPVTVEPTLGQTRIHRRDEGVLVKPEMRGEGKGLRALDADRIGWCGVRLPRPEDVDRRKLPRRARAAGQMAAGDTDGPTWCNSVRQLSGLMDG